MGDAYVNRFGRRATRGLRPWLLLPKVLCVALYVGGLAAAIVMLLGSGFTALDPADPRRAWVIQTIGRLFRWLIVPALLAAIGLGAGLLLQHPRQFLRMRWLLMKLAVLAVLVPAAHLWARSRLNLLRDGAGPAQARQLLGGLVITFIVSAVVVIIARLKPRLGQNWARSYVRPQQPARRQG